MDTPPNCPLDPHTAYTFRRSAPPMGLNHLHLIENHVSTNDCVNNCPHPPLKELIFDGFIKGTTPLLLAIHHGELESVKRIVESWGVDVRTAATYYYHHPSSTQMVKIESVTPLFVASFQGRSKIVRYLLEKGADVTAKTSDEAKPEYDGLTPLNGAVSEHWMAPYRHPLDGQRLERHAIVLSLLEFGADISASQKLLWVNSKLCGVDTTTTLINHGLDVKQRDPSSGRTVLHHWASLPYGITQEEALTIVKLLMDKGADGMARDNLGFTPIMAAANGLGHRLHLTLFEFFLERDDIAIMEKIEAMELAGANILSFAGNNAEQFPKALDYWRRATHLRQAEGSGSYQKKLGQKSIGTVEWTTLDQLEHLIQHPTEYGIKIQSLLLVQLRILSGRSWEAVHHFLDEYMGDSDLQLAYMSYQGKCLELLDIYSAILDTMLLFEPRDKKFWRMSVGVVCSFIYTLSNYESCNPTMVNSEMIRESLRLILATDQLRLADREQDTYIENRYSSAMSTFLTMLLGLQEMPDDIWESLLQLFGRLEHHQLEYLLVRACKDYESVNYFFTIRLLLQLGANVGAVDKDGNGPLHLVAQAESEQSEAAGCLLIGYGARLFRTNNSGKTAVDLWIERNEMEDDKEVDEGAAESRGRPDWCRTVRKLKCLSASCIRVHDVPFKNEPEFFQDSHSFIEKH